MVGDREVISILLKELLRRDYRDGCILDGFPRTIKQAEALDALLSEKNAAIAEIKNQSVELALAMTEQVLRKKLENKKEDEAFLKTLVSDIKLN